MQALESVLHGMHAVSEDAGATPPEGQIMTKGTHQTEWTVEGTVEQQYLTRLTKKLVAPDMAACKVLNLPDRQIQLHVWGKGGGGGGGGM